jgi:hypothetical protein
MEGSGELLDNILQWPSLDPVQHILSFLDIRDLCMLSCVNREWYRVATCDNVWRQVAQSMGVDTQALECVTASTSTSTSTSTSQDQQAPSEAEQEPLALLSWKSRVLAGFSWPRVGEPLSVQDTVGMCIFACDIVWHGLICVFYRKLVDSSSGVQTQYTSCLDLL